LLLMLLFAAAASAHKASDAYLQLRVKPDGVTLRWDIALRDLDAVLPIDADGDRQLSWGEVRKAVPEVEALALKHLEIEGCPLRHAQGVTLERRNDGVYLALSLAAECRPAAELALRYTLFADVDATHRGIARILHVDGHEELRLLDPGAPTAVTDEARASEKASFLGEGVHHIVTGYDHLLFLLCLLLPAVLRRTPGGWQPVHVVRDALKPVLAIVTLFTLAHSITLGLAASGLVSLPSSIIEPAIAVTIIVAAIDNLLPLFGRWRGAVTFAFGLVHGFGFAGALRELHLPAAKFAWALLRFNLGLELGQLAVVALVVPLLYLRRRDSGYRRWVLQAGSMAAIGLAVLWFIERTADIAILPV
jgi:hypothetical protein